ncbi:MAG TPA: hypothetical protein VNW15_06220 [Rhizomicrobium sp.]|jgi:hypothetical protein|nr:hypothetical protein [Rhizomicrobium sp.]
MNAFPTILIVVILYNLAVFGGGAAGYHNMQAILDQSFSVTMFSGDVWRITVSDLFELGALFMLFIETLKAARTSHRAILNHAFSMLTFTAALVEFIVLKGFSTSAFFLITAMCLFDVVAGYTISIVAAKRDMNVVSQER